MAGTSEKVMSMVQEEIGKNPGVTNEELFEKARKLDRRVGGMSRREFNARYTLQVKRRLPGRVRRARAGKRARGGARRGRPRGPRAANAAAAKRGPRANAAGANAAGTGPNAELRAIFVQFARDIAAAESKAGIIDVIADVDRYVERAAKVAAR